MSHDMGAEVKICKSCQVEKPVTEFYRQARQSATGKRYQEGLAAFRHQCKVCHNDQVRRNYDAQRGRYARQRSEYNQRVGRWRKYGMARADYDEMKARQGGKCAICGRQPGEDRLVVDHCHETEEVRGLLCSQCNVAIGLLADDPVRMMAAIEYLATARRVPHVA